MNITTLSFVLYFLLCFRRLSCQSLEEESFPSVNDEKLVDEDVEVFKEDSTGQENEEYYFYPSRYHRYRNRYKRLHPRYFIRNSFHKTPRKSGANSKYPICSYEDTSFIGVDNNILSSLTTDSAYECKFDCKATKNCKFWTYDEAARRGDNNCFLIDLGQGRTPKDVFLDRDYISGTKRNNCKCLRRTDFIEVDRVADDDNNPDARRRRRRRRNRPKLCPRGIKESDDIDYIYDDYEDFNEPLKVAQNSTKQV